MTNPRPDYGWLAAAIAIVFASACSFDQSGIEGDATAGIDARAITDAPTTADRQPHVDSRPAPDADITQAGTILSRPAGDLAMDADASDWGAAIWTEFDIEDAALRANCIATYQPSTRVRFASLHDATYLYFFFQVSDSLLNTDGPYLYDDDAIILYLDAAGDRSGWYGWDDHKIALSDGYWQDYADSSSEISLTGDYATTGAGYNFEIRIRKDSLGAAPLATNLGFDVMLADDDTYGETDCWGWWYIAPAPHCGDCCEGDISYPGCDTSVMGRLVLQ